MEAQAVHNHRRRGMWREAVSPSPPAAEHSIGSILLFKGFNSAKSGSIPSPGLHLWLVGITSLQTSTDLSRACWTDLDQPYLCQEIISSTCPQHSAPPERACEIRQLRQGKLLPQHAGQFLASGKLPQRCRRDRLKTKKCLFLPMLPVVKGDLSCRAWGLETSREGHG